MAFIVTKVVAWYFILAIPCQVFSTVVQWKMVAFMMIRFVAKIVAIVFYVCYGLLG